MSGGAASRAPSPVRLLVGGAVAVVLVVAAILPMVVDGPLLSSTEYEGDSPSAAGTSGGPSAKEAPSPAATKLVDESAVLDAGHRALKAWTAFANTGRSDSIAALIHPLSPQLVLLEREQARVGAGVGEEEPFQMTMEDPVLRPASPGFVSLEGPVVTTRGAEVVSRTTWRVVLTWSEEHADWMIWTLEELG